MANKQMGVQTPVRRTGQDTTIIDKNSPEYIKQRRKDLKKLILISSGIDVLMTIPEMATIIGSFGGSIIAEEIVEYFISITLGKDKLDTEISYLDRAMGFIPIPGVTALSIRCFKELRKLPKK